MTIANRKGTSNDRSRGPSPMGNQDGEIDLFDVSLSEVDEEALDWLWKHRLQMGTVAIVQGPKGVGKSSFIRALIADVTGGRSITRKRKRSRALGNVLYYTGEESISTRVKPCLAAAKADLKRVFCQGRFDRIEGRRTLELPADWERLERRIQQRQAVLTVIDPIFSFLDGQTALEGPTAPAREFMAKLGGVAKRTGNLILLTRNLVKGSSGSALESGRGCNELANAARSVLHLDRIKGQTNLFGLAVAACNDAPPNVPTITYTLKEVLTGVQMFVPKGEIELSADDLAGGEDASLERTLLERAKGLLLRVLKEGEVESKTVKQKAEDEGISVRTLQRAATELCEMPPRREGSGPGMRSFWRLKACFRK